MIAILENEGHMLSFDQIQQWVLTGGALGRLLLAAVLGGAIGIDREIHHRPSGIRTNLLICIGAALFTFLSSVIAGDSSPNKGQIASNIVQGIGFLGAGLILHNRDRVSGLISAATVWAVASIGMACGAGLYAPAVLSAVLVLVVLEIVGLLETRGNLKSYVMLYEVRGEDTAGMTLAILEVLDREKQRFGGVESMPVGHVERLTFSVSAIRKIHQRLEAGLQTQPAIADVKIFRSQEDE
ncbi:MgtC/SapB family protein [Silvibacterium acidisoli]|uniref:MgtC/SapB family protein n=1 Tax=Acidobacteriaceae bacterium ZG23-2 TaxID=2883246 RepID=UPI00406CC5D1